MPRRQHERRCVMARAWLLLALVTGVLAVVVGVAVLGLRSAPVPASPAPSPTAWSSECTEADLVDGACLTWDDIRDTELHTQEAR